MTINRVAFYAAVRKHFGALTQSQVDGFNAILDVWEKSYTARTPLTQLAYCLATAWHETAHTMQPIREHGRGKGRKYGVPVRGRIYYGRGLVQLTWDYNYEKATVELRKLGMLRPTESFVTDPDLVMRPDLAIAIMFEGMEHGWFTGKSLDRRIDAKVDGDEHADFVKGRPIINGTDKAEAIARHADHFLVALLAASTKQGEAVLKPLNPVKAVPAPAPQPTPQKAGFFVRLVRALTRKAA